MCIKVSDSSELLVAYITFPVNAVERTLCSRIYDICFFVRFDLLCCENTLCVMFANHGEYCFAIELRGPGAGA